MLLCEIDLIFLLLFKLYVLNEQLFTWLYKTMILKLKTAFVNLFKAELVYSKKLYFVKSLANFEIVTSGS